MAKPVTKKVSGKKKLRDANQLRPVASGPGEREDALTLPAVFLALAKVFLFLSLLTPLVVSRELLFPFVSGKIIYFRFMVQGALLFYLAAWITGPDRKEFQVAAIVKHPLFISVAAFAGCYFLAGFWGVAVKISLFSNFERGEGGLQMLHYLAYFCLLLFVFRTPRAWRRFFVFSLIVALLVGIYGIGQYREALCLGKAGNDALAIQACHPGTFLNAQARISSTLGNPMYLGIYLFMHLFFILVLILETKNTVGKALWGAAGVFLATIMLMSQSRALVFGIMVALALLLAWAAIRVAGAGKLPTGGALRRAGAVFLAAALPATAVFLLAAYLPWGRRYFDLLHPDAILAALKDRLWVWGIAAASLLERPLGWGPENFSKVVDRYYDPRLFGVESWFDRVHNIFLDYALAGGFPLLALFLAIFTILFFQAGQSIRKESAGGGGGGFLPAACGFTAVVYLLQGLTSFDVVTTYQVLMIFLGYFLCRHASTAAPAGPEQETPRRRYLPWAAGAAALPLLLVSFYRLDYLPLQRAHALSGAIMECEVSLQRELSVANPDFHRLFGEITARFHPVLRHPAPVGGDESFIYLSHLGNRIVVAGAQRGTAIPAGDLLPFVAYVSGEFEAKRDSGELIGSRHYLDAGNLNFNAGRMTGDTRCFDRAERYIDAGLAVTPTRIEFLLAKAEMDIARKDRRTADAALARILSLRPDLRESLAYLFTQYEHRFPAAAPRENILNSQAK